MGNSLHKKTDGNALPYDTQRTVFTTDPIAAVFYGSLWSRCKVPQPKPYEMAYIRNRRREYPNLSHQITGWLLRLFRVSAADTSYDAKNAFHSLFIHELEEQIRQIARREGVQLLLQRVRYAAISVRARQGVTDFLIGQGALPGDALAAHLFRLTYDKAISLSLIHI